MSDAELDSPVAPSLFDLLARSWRLPGAVTAAVFNADGTAVAFAGGGTLALAPLADPERPETRIRRAADTGRQTILPRQSQVRPAPRVEAVAGPVVPFGARSFLTGRAGGGLVSVTPRGQAVPVTAPVTGVPAALAHDPGSGTVAAAEGSRVVLLAPDTPATVLETGAAVHALAFVPRSGMLAVAGPAGITLWQDGVRVGAVALPDAPLRLTASPDGTAVAAGGATRGITLVRLADGAVTPMPDYPTPVDSVGWCPAAEAMVTSGAFRTAAWDWQAGTLGTPREAGRTGLVVVDRIAASPDRPLIAAGYASGLLTLARVGVRDEMLLRGDGAGVTALAWSPDGGQLAFGDAAGVAALVAFPPSLFK